MAAPSRRLALPLILALFAPLVPFARAQQTIATLAGGPLPSVSATTIGLSNPTAIARDQNGDLLILDCSRLYRLQNNQLTQIAGNGAGCSAGFPDDPGDGGPALNATINGGSGLAVDASGNIFFTDSGSNEVRELNAATGDINAAPGSAAAGLNQPWGPARDASGNLFVADQGNNRVVEITPSGAVTTVAAIADPGSLSLDGNGNLYVAQFQTSATAIYKVVLATGVTTVVAGGGTTALAAGVAATAAQLPEITAVYADASGDVYFAAGSNGALNTVFELPAGSSTLQVPAGGALNPNQQINAILADPAGGLDLASSGAGGPVQQLASGTLTTLAGGAAKGGYLDLAQPLNSVIAPEYLNASSGLVISDGPFHSADLLALANGALSVVGSGGNGGGPVIRDAAGNLIAAGTLANGANYSVVSINPSTGQSTVIAGTGVYGYSGDGGLATAATFKSISALASDAQGDLYIADSSASVVREVNAKTGVITTVAGNGTQGETGDGGLATAAELNHPDAIAVDAGGNLFIADTDNGFNASVAFDAFHPPVADGVIRRVDAQTGLITTVAGTPDDASGNPPNLALGAGDGGPATSAGLSLPVGLAVDLAGNLYIADYGEAKIREVIASTGVIETLAGNGQGGASGDGGAPVKAEFRPCDLALDPQGNLYIADCDAGRVREVTEATGAPQASPSSLDFGVQPVNTAAAAQAITLTNPGLAPVTISAIAASGDFAETNDCANLAAGATCTVSVTFTPAVAGARTGTLSVTSTALAAAQTFALSGSGAAPSAALSAATLTFAAQLTHSTSAAQSVTLANSGTAALAITSIAASGDFAETNTCGPSLAAGANCTVSVTFTPSATGIRTGTLTVTDNASGSPQTAALTGPGADLTIAAASGSSTSATVTAGQSATYNLAFTPVNGATGTFALTCAGAPTGAACTPSPASIPLSGTAAIPVTVTVSTTASTAIPPLPPSGDFPWLPVTAATLLLLALTLRRRRRLLLPLATAALLAAAIACGGSPSTSTTTTNPNATPKGAYILTLTATGPGGVTRTQSLTLTVN